VPNLENNPAPVFKSDYGLNDMLHSECTWGMWEHKLKPRGVAGVEDGPVLPTSSFRKKTTLPLKKLMKSRWES